MVNNVMKYKYQLLIIITLLKRLKVEVYFSFSIYTLIIYFVYFVQCFNVDISLIPGQGITLYWFININGQSSGGKLTKLTFQIR